MSENRNKKNVNEAVEKQNEGNRLKAAVSVL